MEKIREKLIALRREKGISQAELSKQTGLSSAAICYWESGERKPSAQACLILSRFYGISVETLIDDNLDIPKY